jgi:TonB family protein
MLNVMVDPAGKPYEIAVVDSIGDDAFEKAAVKGVDKWTFEPATHNGTPVHSGVTFKIVFTHDVPAKAARMKFASACRS